MLRQFFTVALYHILCRYYTVISIFRFHELRHTHATMLQEKGADLVYIQRRLVHVNLCTTTIYLDHLTDMILARGISILNNMYGSK